MNAPTRHTSPTSVGREVLHKLAAYFGWQKMAAVWGVGDDLELVLGEWDDAIAGIHRAVLLESLRRVRDSGEAWPPGLGEFLAVVREVKREAHAAMTGRQGMLRIGSDAHLADPDSEAVQRFRAGISALAKAKAVTGPKPSARIASAQKAEGRALVAAANEGHGGLPALMAVVAKAVAMAGGDEAQALREIERRMEAAA
jgi:hypothetical protein